MDFAASLLELQAEASCPLCLDYLRDPVTTECGHNFCRSCIHQRWEDLQDIFPCPVCLHHCPDRNFKKNTQLCHITDIVKQIPTTGRARELQEEKPLCVKHHEVLTLFCQENLELLCLQCSVSSDYENRLLIPIEEAAAIYRKKLKNYLEALTVEVEDAETGFENQVANIFEVQKRMESCRRELLYECKEFKNSLKGEQDEINASLLVEEKDVKEKLTENREQISNHMLMLNNLLIETAGKYFQTDLDLLTDIESIYSRYENLVTPAVFSYELKEEICILPPHYFGLHKMISTFQVDLTLDPETAHPSLIISRDRKSMTYKARSGFHDPQVRTSYPAVLSSEAFDAGRHYWQVDIGGTGEWSLGICKESFPRNAFISLSPNSRCWHIELCASICGTCRRGHIMQVGIFLDYELGEISFYNMNNRSYLYKFSDTFTEKLMPYFSSAPSSKSLTISIIRDKR
ncbi:tripartite motif-containing protein 60-like [Sturnira hondurensis]|uniref:tripartite motif-containing protein 60-like n=1 Tax=Sturnira hondurensis TaxID=192404 RepID=UPI00187A77C1|nr:tripartite motif-containing protein 60-like [Sturnira hondurensis]